MAHVSSATRGIFNTRGLGFHTSIGDLFINFFGVPFKVAPSRFRVLVLRLESQ